MSNWKFDGEMNWLEQAKGAASILEGFSTLYYNRMPREQQNGFDQLFKFMQAMTAIPLSQPPKEESGEQGEVAYSAQDMWECWQASKHYFRGNTQPLNFNDWIKTITRKINYNG